MVSRLTGCSNSEVASLASILSASISYLTLIEDQCPTYNGIALQTDKGVGTDCTRSGHDSRPMDKKYSRREKLIVL